MLNNKPEPQSTTLPSTQPRRTVKLNAETLRALEVQDGTARAPAFTWSLCNCDPTTPQ